MLRTWALQDGRTMFRVVIEGLLVNVQLRSGPFSLVKDRLASILNLRLPPQPHSTIKVEAVGDAGSVENVKQFVAIVVVFGVDGRGRGSAFVHGVSCHERVPLVLHRQHVQKLIVAALSQKCYVF